MPPAQETVFLAQPAVSGARQIISSPFQFQFTGEDRLQVAIHSSVATVVGMTLRFIDEAGEIDVAQHGFSVPGDRIIHAFTVPMGRGFVSNVVVRANNSAIQTGQCYVVIFVVRGGSTGPLVVIGQILGGYTTLFAPLAWPGSPIVAPTEGAGAQVSIALPNPGAGAELSVSVPISTRWAVTNFFATYIAAAGGVDRQVALVYGNLAVNFGRFPQRAPTPPGSGVVYTWGRGLTSLTAAVANIGATAPIPIETVLPAGTTIDTMTANPGVADFWSGAAITVEEWLQF